MSFTITTTTCPLLDTNMILTSEEVRLEGCCSYTPCLEILLRPDRSYEIRLQYPFTRRQGASLRTLCAKAMIKCFRAKYKKNLQGLSPLAPFPGWKDQ